ncbi:MAG TPA: DUF2058 domain-containing protein [Steroidobacteraceae bacterium]|nr:DUF2058 domain-containing protein [Steroidobacteraceae bacterium]
MSLSLREQLLKAGLVTEQQVQRAEREQRQQQRGAPNLPKDRRRNPGPTPQQIAAQKAAAEKAAKDAELNRKKQEKAERRARFAEIRQLVEQHQVPRVETDDFYNFQDGSKIRRVSVTPALRGRLIAGELAIVRCEGRYAFVPAAVGQRVRERVERALIHWNDPAAKPAADDPYKDFAVPDDLMW